jgi:hypothetical protein
MQIYAGQSVIQRQTMTLKAKVNWMLEQVIIFSADKAILNRFDIPYS